MDINYKLIVDTRERKIHDNDNFKNLLKTDFADLEIEIVVKQLAVSDFAITYRDHLLMLIERKTWKDLSQTIRDNKRKYNYKKMHTHIETQNDANIHSQTHSVTHTQIHTYKHIQTHSYI